MTDVISERVSVRSFTDEPVSDEDLRALAVAAMAAPSAGNQMPWVLFIVRDKKVLEKLSRVSPYAKPAAGSAATIVLAMREEGARFKVMLPQDMGAATENVLLRAVELGLGAVWLGIYPLQDRMDAVAEAVSMEEGITPFALVALGHPDKLVEPKGESRFDETRVRWI